MSDALHKLIEAIDTGVGPGNHVLLALDTLDQIKWAVEAWEGSLDAAKALHEALLPGWFWGCGSGDGQPFGAGVGRDDNDRFLAEADNPGRAWLLAILRAYATQREPAA